MKKRTLVNWVLFSVLLLSALNASAGGDDDAMLGNWIDPMTGEITRFGHTTVINLTEDQVLDVHLDTRFASSDLSSAAPLYINYRFGPYTGTVGPVDELDIYSVTLSGGEQAFGHTFPIQIDLSSECLASNGDNFSLYIELSLVTPSPSGFVPYDLLSEPQLFPLGMFRQTTAPFPPAFYSGTKTVDCDPYTGSRRLAATNQLAAPASALNVQSVNPNPFMDEFKLTFQLSKAAQVQLELRDLTGKLFYEKKSLLLREGLHEEIIQLQGLAPGLWLLRLNTAEASQTIRLIKQ